jgi:hypothetical protein
MGKYPPVGDHKVDPRRFIGERFFLMHTWGFSSPNDYLAMITGLSAGNYGDSAFNCSLHQHQIQLAERILQPAHAVIS